MTHINKFGVGNFRVFREYQEFQFAPLTILTGTNSSGKSSLTKAMMLLKESMIDSKLFNLDFNKTKLKLGTFSQNLHTDSGNDIMQVEIDFSGNNKRKNISFSLDTNDEINNYTLNLLYQNSKLFESIYKKNNCNIFENKYDFEPYFDIDDDTRKLTWNITPKSISFNDDLYEKMKKELDDELFSDLIYYICSRIQQDIALRSGILNHCDIFEFYKSIVDCINSIGQGSEILYTDDNGKTHKYFNAVSDNSTLKDFLNDQIIMKIPPSIQNIKLADLIEKVEFEDFEFSLFNQRFNSIHYIPGVRANQEIVFSFQDYPLLHEVQIQFDRYKNEEYKINSEQSNLFPVNGFLQKWLIDEFKIISNIEDLQFNLIEGYGMSIKLSKEKSLYQVGYGVTQLLPIILQIALFENSVFIIEEPEANLHPALQSKMADMFMEAIKKFNIQLIVETHSEYLIRKLQYLTAKKEISSEDTQIYYFYPPEEVPEGENQIYPINILEDGSLSKNFGKGFFDEAGNLDLLLYQMTQSRKN